MATVIPNPYNDALARTSENILQTMMQNRRMQLQESQFVRQLAQNQNQFDETMTERRKAGALERLQFFAPFKVGQTIAEDPIAQADMDVLFPEFQGQFADPNQLGGMQFGQESLDSYLGQRAIETYEGLSEDVRGELDERMISRATTGQAVRGSQLQAQGDLFDLQWENSQRLLQDPEVLAEVTRGFLGVEQPVSVTFGGKVYNWDNATEAGIALRMMEMSFGRQSLSAQSGQAWQSSIDDLATDLTEFARDNEIGISKGIAKRIVETIHAPPPEELEDPEEIRQWRESQIEELRGSLSSHGQAAMQLYVNGASMVNPLTEYLETAAPGALTYLQLSALADEAGLSSDQKDSLVPKMARSLSESGINISHTRRLPFTSWDVNPGGVTPGQEGAATTQGGEGGPSREQLMNQMRADAQALARGEISMQEISSKYDQAQANAVFNAASLLMNAGGNR